MYIFKARIKDILQHRVFKFLVVGAVGASIQIGSLEFIWRPLLSWFQLATFLSIETAIVSNFLINNYWTFADRRAELSQFPKKFLQFNLASSGSILIQLVIAFIGETFIGLFPLFTVPLINFTVDTGTMYAVTGILVGMFWNFFAYSNLIWKKES